MRSSDGSLERIVGTAASAGNPNKASLIVTLPGNGKSFK